MAQGASFAFFVEDDTRPQASRGASTRCEAKTSRRGSERDTKRPHNDFRLAESLDAASERLPAKELHTDTHTQARAFYTH